jgi:recombination protein RecR
MRVPKPLTNVIESFEKLPGIGPKTAQRLGYYLLHVPQGDLDSFSDALTSLKKNTVLCSVCKNVSDHDPCSICGDSARDKSTILVVEQPLDLLAFERAGRYNGVYHVLHGVINPLENIGPDEIFIEQLLHRVIGAGPATRQPQIHPQGDPGFGAPRLASPAHSVSEVIIATNPNMEGDATAMYISRKIKSLEGLEDIKVTRLGMGIPTGADLEYADEITLRQAIEGRRQL